MAAPPEPTSDTLPAARVARAALLASFALLAAIVLALFAERQWLVDRTSGAALAVSRALEVSNEIELAGAQMAHAVALAVETGDISWHTAFEAQVPKMAASIARARQLAPLSHGDGLGIAVRDANDGLVAHHRRVLRMLETGWPDAARGLMDAHEFVAKRRELADGIFGFTKAMRAQLEAQAQAERRRAWVTVLPLVTGALLALGLLWQRLSRALLQAEADHRQQSERRATLDRELVLKAGMLEQSDLGTWVWLPETDELQLNPLARRLLRLPHESDADGAMTLQQLVSRIHPDDVASLNDILSRHLKGELAVIEGEYRLQHTQGDWLWVSLRGGVAERDAQGRATVLAGTAMDVTERQAVMQRWGARADLSGDFFWQTDVDRRFTLLAGAQVPGVAPVEVILGERALTPGMPVPLPEHAERLEQAIAQRVPYHGLIYRQVDAHGKEHFLEVDARPRHDPTGRFLGFEGVGRDVSERIRVMRQLEESLRLVDAVLEAIPLPVVMKSPQGQYMRHNRAFAELSGLSGEGLAAMDAFDMLDAAAVQRHQEADNALHAQPGSIRYELRQQFGDKPPMDALIHKSTVTGSNGEVLGIVATTIDITEQKNHARALMEACHAADAANRAKSAFLAAMSHEIRTPMNGVLGLSELLSHTALDAEQAQTVHIIRESATALLRILDDILDFSKIEAGRMSLEDNTLALHPWLDGLCESLAPVAAQRGVRLTASVSPDLEAAILGDEVRLRQIVLNLAGNAIKFSGGRQTQRGDVRLRVGRRADDLFVEVRDNGIGIAPDKLAQLFEAFTQAEANTTRRYGGTGLGLAISQRLARLMNGDIDAISEPGVGSTFTLRVPLRLPLPLPLPLHPPPHPSAPAPELEGITVQLLPDPAVPEDVLREWLTRAGASVLSLDPDARLRAPAHQHAAPHAAVIVAQDQTDLRALIDGASPATPCLLLGYGQRTGARLLAPTMAGLDMLLQGPFLRAIALLAGRASPADAQPAPPMPEVTSRGVAFTADQAEASGQLILVAEDDLVNQTVILKQLALLGYTAEVAVNGALALQMWRSGRFALLLSDLHMPEMDGFELVRAIRDDEAQHDNATQDNGCCAPRARLLALTANALRGEDTRAREAGFDDYLTKPLPLRRLQAALKGWMPKPRPVVEPSSQVLDLEVLRDLVSQDEEAVHELLREFLAHASQQLDALADAVTGCHTEQARSLAHSLKSSSRSIGALPLAACCAELERHPNAKPLLPQLQACSRRTLAAVKLALSPTPAQPSALEATPASA